MKSKPLAVGMIAMLALMASGCASQDGNTVEARARQVTVVLLDGSKVPCIIYDRGISCDYSKVVNS